MIPSIDFIPDKSSFTFNFKFFQCRNTKNLEVSLEKFLKQDGPSIMEIYGRYDQQYIEISHTKNQNGKIVRRPLEDQWPFLDRQTFLRQMIVEPIDQ